MLANPKTYSPARTSPAQPASVQLSGGTSEAAPLTAGVAALVIQAYAESHGGTDPIPAVVKQIITSTAQDINAPADQQGAGLHRRLSGGAGGQILPRLHRTRRGAALLAGASQLHAAGLPATTQTLTDTISNDGSRSQTIALSSRTLGAYQTLSTSTADLTMQRATLRSCTSRCHPNRPASTAPLPSWVLGPPAISPPTVNLSLIDPDRKAGRVQPAARDR